MNFDLEKPLPNLPEMTPERLDLFFSVLSTTGRVRHSAMRAGLEPIVLSKHLANNPELRERKLDAMKSFAEVIEAEIYRRAIEGVPKGVYYKGEKVDEELVYSDMLLDRLAKAKIPEYRERVDVDATVKAGVLVVQTSLDPDEWAKKYGSERDNGPIHADEERLDGGRSEPVEAEHLDAG